jgi:hypothetical protein
MLGQQTMEGPCFFSLSDLQIFVFNQVPRIEPEQAEREALRQNKDKRKGRGSKKERKIEFLVEFGATNNQPRLCPPLRL